MTFLLPLILFTLLTTPLYADRKEIVEAEIDKYEDPQNMKFVGFEESKSDCTYPPSMEPVFKDGVLTGYVVRCDERCKE
jgi:hypothetical protein